MTEPTGAGRLYSDDPRCTCGTAHDDDPCPVCDEGGRSWREWWSGNPLLRRHPLRWLIWLADEALDRIPVREDGRWYRRGGLGCRLALHRWWFVEETPARVLPAENGPTGGAA